MVARGRLLALWFVSILVLSVFPAVVPTAQAESVPPTITAFKIEVKHPGDADFHNATNNEVIRKGDRLRFYVAMTTQACSTTPASEVGTADAQNITFSVDTTGIGSFSSVDILKEQRGPEAGHVVEAITKEIIVESLDNGKEASEFKFMGTATAHCSGYTLGGSSKLGTPEPTSNYITIDNKPPALANGAVQVSWVNTAPNTANLSSNAKLGAGAKVRLDFTATDFTGIAGINVTTSAVNSGTPVVTVPANGATSFTGFHEFTIPAGIDAARTVTVTTYDTLGNELNTPVAVRLVIDSVAPTTPVLNAKGFLAQTVGSNEAKAHFAWDSPAGETIAPAVAQYRVNGVHFFNMTTATAPAAFPVASPFAAVDVKLHSVDVGGNVGTAASAVVAPSFPRITALTYGTPPGQHALLRPNGLGTLTFTLDGAADLPPTYHDVSVTLRHETHGFLREGASGSQASHYVPAASGGRHYHPTASGHAYTLANFTGADLIEGNFVLNVTVNGTSGNRLHFNAPFKVDRDPPVLSHPSGTGGLVIDARTLGGSVKHVLDGNPVDVALRIADTKASDSGIANFTVEVIQRDEQAVARRADGSLARYSFTVNDCHPLPSGAFAQCLASAPSMPIERNRAYFQPDGKLFVGAVNVSFFDLPPGSYRIRVHARDVAGNAATFVSSADEANLFHVVQRAALVSNAALPFAGPSKILVSGLAAVDLPPEAQGGKTCVPKAPGQPATVCRVTQATFLARNRNLDGTFEAERTLGNMFLVGIEPEESLTVQLPHHASTDPGHAFKMFNMTPPGGYDYPAGVTPSKQVQVRMKTTVVVGSQTYETDTGWLNANSLTQPALAATNPSLAGWKFNTTGVVDYNVTFDLKAAGGNPRLNYSLTRHHPAEGTSTTPFKVEGDFPSATRGTVTFFNGTFGTPANPLPEGEYTVVFTAWDGTLLKATTEKTFAVASRSDATKPTIAFPGPQPANGNLVQRGATPIFDVGPVFNLSFRVNHGLLNVTDLSNLTFDLTRSVPRDALGTLLPNGTGGFRVDVLAHTPFDNPRRSQTNVTVQVTLPANARDGDAFALRVNATTDGRWSPGTPSDATRYVASAIATLKLDKDAPKVDVLHAQTNATGDGPQLRILGLAEDGGSGIDGVEVRVVDLTNNRTLLWQGASGPAYAQGVSDAPDAFATSGVVLDGASGGARAIRNVKTVLVDPGTGRYSWSLDQWDRPVLMPDGTPDPSGARWRPLSELDNETLYRVDVRARDHLGQVSDVISREVRFDTRAPVILGAEEGSGIGVSTATPGEVGWHGRPSDAQFFVNVSDNKCLKRVSLRGFDAAGNAFGPVDMRPVSPFQCTEAMRGQPVAWTVTASEAPALADAVGNVRYYVEAEDATGLVARGSTSPSMTLGLTVRDTFAPVVRYVNPDPPLMGESSTSLLRAGVFENHAIGLVEVFVGRIHPGGGVTLVGNGTMQPEGTPAANGTGMYVAETGRDLNLDLRRGDYLVQVRAMDVTGTCGSAANPCALVNAILRVSDAAAPSVSDAVPGRTFVNGTPALAYRVVDPSVPQSGVTVRVGNATDAMAAINATFEPIQGANGTRAGWSVAIAPRDLVTGENLLVEVRAAGNLTTTRSFNYTIDATPPTVNHTVTGLVTVGERQWVGPLTRVAVNASDEGSGVSRVTYTVNGVPVPTTPTLTPTGRAGKWTLEYVATDNASNVARGQVSLDLDGNGPNVTVSTHGDTVIVIVNDAGSGVDDGNVTVHYAYNGSTPFLSKKMEKAAGTSNSFTASLGGNASATGLRYWFEAKDRLGNVGRLYDAASPHVIPRRDGGGEQPFNTPPTVRITSPSAGASVRDRVELKWTSFDNEAQPLTVTIGLQEPNRPTPRALVTDGPDNGTYALNVSGFAAGTYRFTVVVSDGIATSTQESRAFVIEAGKAVSVITPIPAVVRPNEEATFLVQLAPAGKEVESATFTVTRDGAAFASGTLRPEGQYHAGTVTPKEPGAYTVSVVVTYKDKTQDAPVQVASFSVAAPVVEAATPVSFLALLVAAALTVALAAFGAFGRWK